MIHEHVYEELMMYMYDAHAPSACRRYYFYTSKAMILMQLSFVPV